MDKKNIEKLAQCGQSVWFDYISRSLIEKGRLKDLIDLGVTGMTSNPTIFDNAISRGADYDDMISQLSQSGKSTFEIYDDLTVRDVQDAASIFIPVFEKTNFLDGYVSLEVNPLLALKTKETIEEARRLFKKVNRQNVMFKIPSTDAGLGAIEELLADGINVNVTLIFSLGQYEKTANAFLKGLKRLSKKTNDLSKISSVASVFVSRIDTAIDKMLDKSPSLKGKAAVANSNIIYQKYLEIFSGKDFRKLKEKGLRAQRVLWASTSAKNPAYSDIKYVTELIGKDTINTMPENTFEAFLDHGEAKEALNAEAEGGYAVIEELKNLGIDINEVCKKLLIDGVIAFEKSFLSLLNSIEEKQNEKIIAHYRNAKRR